MEKLLALTLPGEPGKEPVLNNPPGVDWLNNIGDLIGRFLPYVFAFAGFGLLLMIVSAGYTYLTSAGDAKAMESAKQRLTNGLTGFIIIFVAFWIVQIAGVIFGIEEIKTVFQ
jgi:hypothetical protein